MATLASLIVEISARTAGLRAGLNAAQSQVRRFATNAANILKSIGKVMTAGLVGAIAGLTAIIASNSKAAKNLINVSNAIGVSVKSLTEWEAAAKKVGIESDKMNDILKDTADKIGDFISTGGGEAADIFEQLNLNIKDFVNLNAGDSLLKIGQAMSNLTNKEQVFLMESLADEASSLLPLFKNNAEGYKAAIDEAVKSGNILTRSQAESAASFSKSVGVFRQKIAGFGKQLTVQLAKPFSKMIDWINEAIGKFGGIDKVAKRMAIAIISGVKSSISAMQQLLKVFVKLENLMLRIENIKLLPSVAAEAVASQVAGTPGLVGENTQRSFDNQNQINRNNAGLNDNSYIKSLDGILEQLKNSIGAGVGESVGQLVKPEHFKTMQDSIKSTNERSEADKKAAEKINNLASSAGKAAEAINPKKQESKSSASVTSLHDFKSRMEANRINPDLTNGSGATFRGKDSSGIFGGGFTGSDGVKSVQDYINESPTSKKLQEMRSGKFGENSGNLGPVKPTTKITLEMVTDAGKVAGELEGNQEFINAIARLQEKQTNKSAKQAAN